MSKAMCLLGFLGLVSPAVLANPNPVTIECPQTLAFAVPQGWQEHMSGPARFQRAEIMTAQSTNVANAPHRQVQTSLTCHYRYHGPSSPVVDVNFQIVRSIPQGQTCTVAANRFNCR